MRVQVRLGCEIWMKLGPSMSCEHLADRHKPAHRSSGSKKLAYRESRSLKRKPLNTAKIPGDIL